MALNQVNCGTCHACCHSIVLLHPTDDASQYKTTRHAGRTILERKPNGDCTYLEQGKCSIWPNHPAVCQAFDCAAHYMSMTRARRRKLIDPAIHKAGQQKAAERVQALRQLAAAEVVRRIEGMTQQSVARASAVARRTVEVGQSRALGAVERGLEAPTITRTILKQG